MLAVLVSLLVIRHLEHHHHQSATSSLAPSQRCYLSWTGGEMSISPVKSPMHNSPHVRSPPTLLSPPHSPPKPNPPRLFSPVPGPPNKTAVDTVESQVGLPLQPKVLCAWHRPFSLPRAAVRTTFASLSGSLLHCFGCCLEGRNVTW